MRGIDALRTSPPAHALGHARAVAEALASRGWAVPGCVVDPAVDVAARRRWSRRSGVHANLHILVQIDTAAERHLLFDAAPPSVPDEMLPSYWIGEHERELADILDDDQRSAIQRQAFSRGEARIARAIASAPLSPLVATAWRDVNDEPHAAIDRAFASAAHAEAAFLRHDLEVLRDDAELAVVDAVDLVAPLLGELHHFLPVVMTDAAMWTARDDVTPIARVRAVRRSLAGADHRWIDIVHISAIEAFFDQVTMHFAALYTRRRFT